VGGLAEVPTMSTATLLAEGSWMSGFRAVYPADDAPGKPAPNRIGNIKAPTLYICGADDFAILCTREYSKNTKNFVDGEYKFLAVEDCGHDILKCASDQSTLKVIESITELIVANS
jgi:pimeloyl-ACP methyl ester carboxylesterase